MQLLCQGQPSLNLISYSYNSNVRVLVCWSSLYGHLTTATLHCVHVVCHCVQCTCSVSLCTVHVVCHCVLYM